MCPENMVRRQLYLTKDLNRQLKKCSNAARISESEILREALGQYLEREKRRSTPQEDNPVLKMKGLFSGDDDCLLAAERHDDIVYEGTDE